MAFNSLPFLGFLAVVYAVFRMAPASMRAGVLLFASAGFFVWASPSSAALLLSCSLLDFYGARRLERLAPEPDRQRRWLIFFVTIQVVLLVICKSSPLRAAANALLHFSATGQWNLAAVALPLGCSFFIFQGIGYLVDTAWGRDAERSLPRFLLFMSFFPKVFMGPIERGFDLLPQIAALRDARFSYDEFRVGLLRFGWGLFKKVVIADRLALYVSEVYGHPGGYFGSVVITAILLFPLQLLADFSGYSDMALGCAQLFHLRLVQNFEAPYAAANIQEFWRRWHVSFSSWVAAFVFTPLRMKWRRWKKAGLILSIYVTFLLIGLWHGFEINYVIVWLLHGTFICISTLTLKKREAQWERLGLLHRPWFHALRVATTFLLVSGSFVFFRTQTPREALAVFAHAGRWQGLQIGIHDGLSGPELTITFAMLAIWGCFEGFFHAPERISAFLSRPLVQRWPAYGLLLLGILCFGVFRNPAQFIYLGF